MVSGEVKARKRRRKHRTLIGALQVWSGKEPEINPDSNQTNSSSSQNYNVTNNNSTVGGPENAEPIIEEIEEEAKNKTHKLDKVAVIVLPPLFIAFNIAYWLHYTA